MGFKKGNISKNIIKDKKLMKIRDSNICVDIKKEKDFVIVTIDIDQLIEPACRPRTSSIHGFVIYDPLKEYKNYIKKIITESLNNNSLGINFPYGDYYKTELILTIPPSSSWSNKRKYYSILNEYCFTKKPDIDNCEKTIFDCVNKLIFEDDSAIVESYGKKQFGFEEHTTIKFYLYKYKDFPRTLSKNDKIEWGKIKDKIKYIERNDDYE